ncbi:hypothetical protein PIB30_023703 [Stylosanthes scabra]|uniref:RRM domain-containing protein n=1 Tax=Stylosanthes scabra TaxID=79078 RepID=A0ABU6U924_9FABA|nr:hypothetical protein [Stylosanthes scabra]
MRGFTKVFQEQSVRRGVTLREKHCERRDGNGFGKQSWRDALLGVNRTNNADERNEDRWLVQRSRRFRKQRNSNETAVDKWTALERKTHSIFVDNLPSHVSKRFLYREFRIHGNVVDAFISRRPRNEKHGLFAFIRYDSKGGAVREMKKLDGTYIAGKGVLVKEANVRRRSMEEEAKERSRKCIRKWARKNSNDQANKEDPVRNDGGVPRPQLVQRLDSLGEQYRKIECMDLGPKKCILSMDTVELHNRALLDGIFMDIFDEVKEYWRCKWAFSQRVWGMDAKLVMQDEITEDQKSFSVTRIIIDSFQWEPIQQWLTIKCE